MINLEDIYEVMNIIKKKETREGLTKEETAKLNNYYKTFQTKSRQAIRYSQKHTRLYDLSLFEYMCKQIPESTISDEDKQTLIHFHEKEILKLLIDIIRKKDEKESPTRFEHMKLNELYRKYPEIEKDPIKLFDFLYEKNNRSYSTEEKVEFNLFRTLLDNKNQTIRLSELYKLVYKDIYSEEEILSKITDSKEMLSFFEKINGCVLEETVSNIDISNIDINDLKSIKIDYGTDIDPLLLVKSTKPVPMISIEPTTEEMTFIIISDAHLDQNCYREENGQMVVDEERLRRNLNAFSLFKRALLTKLGNIKGIIYTGDILDGFFERNKGTVTKLTASNLTGAMIRFERRAKEIEKMNQIFIQGGEEPVLETETSLSGGEASLVAYLAGNHDMRVGRSKFDKIMRLFEKHFFDPRSINLGNGSARIKVGEEFISLMHHNSLDWGLNDDDNKQTRRIRNKASFRFEEYFEICKAFYGEAGSIERQNFEREFNEAKAKDPNIDTVYFLMSKVNEKMFQQNKDLYYFYLPYIIPNSDKVSYANVDEDTKAFKPKKNMSFFRNFLVIDNGELRIRQRGAGNTIYPSVDVYRSFVDSEDEKSFTIRLNDAVQKLNDPKYHYEVIPQFGRNDAYTPRLVSLAHFHAALSNEKTDGTGGRAKSHSLTKGKGKNRQWFLDAVIQQDHGMFQRSTNGETRLSAMVYKLRFNAKKIMEISVTPYKWKTNINTALTPDIKEGETITYKAR